MTSPYPHVFSPIAIGPVEVKNRFYFPPHGTPLNSGGGPSDDFAYYYAERAAGGCGLLIQSLPVLPKILGRQCPYYEETIPSFKAVADLVHENGARLFGQLHYWWGGGDQWEPLSPPAPAIGPSAYQRFDHYSVTHEMGIDEIRMLIDAFGRCAHHLAQAGYDGIELHLSHGIIGEHFLSPYWNRRRDEYGGELEGRMRFAVDALRAIRDAVGSELAVGVRFNCDEMLPGGWTQDDAREILARFASAGLIDFADLDIAVEPNQFPLGMPPYFVPRFSNESFVKGVRDALGSLPVLSALGRVTSVADADRAIADGSADLVGAARGLIAEPELVKNALEGREERSRTCIACNWCVLAGQIRAFGCAINPASARERRWGVRTLTPVADASRVVVVGGGPGGLEAARVAAHLGHDVVLLERRETLGGQMSLWARLPGRDALATTPEWYARELRELGVDVRTGVEASAGRVLAESPDAVVVATGSRYAENGESGFMASAIPGWDRDFVYRPEQIIEQGARPSGRVVILDDEGLNTGVGIAEILAAAGAQVEIVTRWLRPAEHLIFTFEFAFVIPRLKQLGVAYRTQTYVSEIGDHELTVFDVFTNEERKVSDVDAVVLVTMRRPKAALARELEGKAAQLFPIGDALAPRGLAEATYEGQRFARMIGVEGAPRTFAEAFVERLPADVYSRPAARMRPTSAVAP